MTIRHIKNSDILKALSFKDCNHIVEQAFLDYENGDSQMPHKIYLDLPQYHGDFRAMPAYNKRYNLAGIKWVNSHSLNHQKNIPSVMATLLLNKPDTGELMAIMDATAITALRTGAAGAIGVKYCANKLAKTTAYIGAGEQAKTQFNCIDIIQPSDNIMIFDLNPSVSHQFKAHIEKTSRAKVTIASSVKTAVSNADIIVTTTPSTSPILKKEWLKPSAHINAIGADTKGKQECEHSILKAGQIIVDDIAQAIESGELNTAIQQKLITKKNISATIGELISGKKTINKNKLTLFDSTGLAIQDLALAGYYLLLRP